MERVRPRTPRPGAVTDEDHRSHQAGAGARCADRRRPDGKWIDESDLAYTINEPDAYALEEALQLKEKNGGEVIALCAGPERVASTLREALAKGADRAIHILADPTTWPSATPSPSPICSPMRSARSRPT